MQLRKAGNVLRDVSGRVTAQRFRAEFADDYRAVDELLSQRLEREESGPYPRSTGRTGISRRMPFRRGGLR